MAAPWVNVFKEVPADTDTVWIVRLPYYDTPVLAVWDEAGAVFTWQDSAANSHDIDLEAVFKWRPV